MLGSKAVSLQRFIIVTMFDIFPLSNSPLTFCAFALSIKASRRLQGRIWSLGSSPVLVCFCLFGRLFLSFRYFPFLLMVYDRIASVPDHCIQELNVVFVPHLTMAYKETCCARMCIMHCYSFQGVRVQSWTWVILLCSSTSVIDEYMIVLFTSP